MMEDYALLFSIVEPISKAEIAVENPCLAIKNITQPDYKTKCFHCSFMTKRFKRRCFFFRIFLVNSWRCWIISTTTFFVFFDHLFFTEYQCFYVTCEYTGWSEWSSSCGNGMKRVRRLSKQTERIKEQQGGCSGLTTTCEKEQLETKNTQCE